jgi:hypothetical protein
VIEHPDIGNILPLDGKDTAGKPIRGFKISLSRSGWLIYDEPAAREMHKMLAEMIAKWDAPNAPVSVGDKPSAPVDCSALDTMRDDNQFLASMMLIKFAPTNYCLSSQERKRLDDCYKRAFAKPNAPRQP